MDGIQRIRSILTDAGLSVYDPGEHPNVCKAPYIVVRQMGTYSMAESSRIGYTLATVNLYVPLNEYDRLNAIAAQIKTILAPIFVQVRPTGHESPDMIEEDYKAHSRSIEYQILKKLKE